MNTISRWLTPAAGSSAAALFLAAFASAAAASTPAGPVPPRVVVLPSGTAYLVLEAGPQLRDGAVACDVTYLAAADGSDPASPEAERRFAATARELAAVFSPIVEVTAIERLSITAVVGKPGADGRIERRWFVRDGAGWHAQAEAIERGTAPVPAVAVVSRDPEEEASAREAAAAFMSAADRADFDAAWARTSALLKAAVSRADFERTLAQRPRSRGAGDVYVAFAFPLDRFLPGSVVEAWSARDTSQGPVVETLALRLDDDGEWRVADAVQLLRKPASAAPAERRGAALETAGVP